MDEACENWFYPDPAEASIPLEYALAIGILCSDSLPSLQLLVCD